MTSGAGAVQRCGIDTVEIARIERLLRETPPADLLRFFTAQELADAAMYRDKRSSKLAA